MSVHPRTYEGPQNPSAAFRQEVEVSETYDYAGRKWVDLFYVGEPSIHTSFKWKSEYGSLPQPGDRFLALTKTGDWGFGTMNHVRGMARVDGSLLYFNTPATIKRRMLREQRKEEQKRREHVEKNRQSNLDRIAALRYDASREFFRKGIEEVGFDKWAMEYMGLEYELFTFEQAENLADHVRGLHWYVSDIDAWFEKFVKADHKEQEALWPSMDEGHSGNTFGLAVKRAWALARGNK